MSAYRHVVFELNAIRRKNASRYGTRQSYLQVEFEIRRLMKSINLIDIQLSADQLVYKMGSLFWQQSTSRSEIEAIQRRRKASKVSVYTTF